jgi:CheY-like chemotaxis protein
LTTASARGTDGLMRDSGSGRRSGKGAKVNSEERKILILMADDDRDDCMLFEEALRESTLDFQLLCVENGQALTEYLEECGNQGESAPRPDLIILDLNMPVKDGRQALREIRANRALKDINVMVLTESKNEVDQLLCYGLGVKAFLSKTDWLQILVEIVKSSGEYWFDLVSPGTRRRPQTPENDTLHCSHSPQDIV